MRTLIHRLVVAVLAVHGLLHLLGVVEGLELADVAALDQPIGTTAALAWLLAAGLVLAAAVQLARQATGWWVLAALAAVTSQAVIVTAWTDARVGTVANVVLVVAAAYGWAADGPRGLRAEYHRRARQLVDPAVPQGVLTDQDLAALPAPVATYIRRSGAVGKPRPTGFQARIHGRIRAGVGKPWMRYTGEQVDTFGRTPSRLFLLDATMLGLPADVLHVYEGGHATMRVRAGSLVTMVDAAGPEMDRGETVTVLNDLCLLAPGALADAPISWEQLDRNRVRATYTPVGPTVSAELVFDDHGDLVDFVSDDRFRASPDGRSFTLQRWSTPVRGHRDIRGHRLPVPGDGVWHAPEPEGTFSYIEFDVDDLTYRAAPTPARTPARVL